MDRTSSNFSYWRELGLSVRAANILVNLACETKENVAALGAEALQKVHGMGPPTYNEIARLMGWPECPVPEKRPRRRREPDVQNPKLPTYADVAKALGWDDQEPQPEEEDDLGEDGLATVFDLIEQHKRRQP